MNDKKEDVLEQLSPTLVLFADGKLALVRSEDGKRWSIINKKVKVLWSVTTADLSPGPKT